jgi:hypothetical protein
LPNVTDTHLTSLGIKMTIDGKEVEVVWNAHSDILAVSPVPNALAALRLMSLLSGGEVVVGARAGAGPGPAQVAPQAAAPPPPPPPPPAPPAQPQLSLVPPVQQPAPAAPTPPPTQNMPAAAAPPPPAQPAAPQPANPAQPGDEVFGRAMTLKEVVEELIRRGVPEGTADAEAYVIGQAQAIRARGVSPLLSGLTDADFEEDVRVAAIGPLIMAGLR